LPPDFAKTRHGVIEFLPQFQAYRSKQGPPRATDKLRGMTGFVRSFGANRQVRPEAQGIGHPGVDTSCRESRTGS
jgi:hypothetical protein